MTRTDIPWSQIDQPRFYLIGTGLYSLLTTCLHPINVLKIRQQVTSPNNNAPLQLLSTITRIRHAFSGLGVVLSIAVPARALYIFILEGSKENLSYRFHPPSESALFVQRSSSESSSSSKSSNNDVSTAAATTTWISGIAGGMAGLSAQILVVPMDVISQRQIIHGGSAFQVARGVLKEDGWRGLYRGFGVSIVSSLPAGVTWWAAYGGCRHYLMNQTTVNNHDKLWVWGGVQLTAGIMAGIAASAVTQPLDVIKTRYQVKRDGGTTLGDVVRRLWIKRGVGGFYRGIGPRIANMALWGTVMSSAYEYLKFVSRKEAVGYGIRRESIRYITEELNKDGY